MLRQIEGSRAVTEAVALCRAEVICAYPIGPQTHIVDALGAEVRAGRLGSCEVLSVESESAAMSVSIGASVAGARVYTATGSQGLLHMPEAVGNAAGLGLPIVMTVANRAIGAPETSRDDHRDAMSLRDAGWIQLYAGTSQDALDLHVQAFRIAEELSVPVTVCLDGFLLNGTHDRAEVPTQSQVDAFLLAREPRHVPRPAGAAPVGAMVLRLPPTGAGYLAHARQSHALGLIPEIAAEFAKTFGRDSGGLVRGYRLEDAETVVVALGSVVGTISNTVDELRDGGMRVGVLGITAFRPFPMQAIRDVLGTGRRARRLVVLERALASGLGGILSADLRVTLAGGGVAPGLYEPPIVSTVIAGLGGRPITRESLRRVLTDARAGVLPPLSFLS
jgi:pyruvate ferredoxin oxidoreductase alpha subunit